MKIKLTILYVGIMIASGFFKSFASADSASIDLNFEVRGAYMRAINKEKINTARTMADIIPFYPASWILEYISTEVTIKSNAQTTKATGKNDVLTTEQTALLNTAGFGSEIEISIKYKCKNSVTDKIEESQMRYRVSVIPNKEAEYTEGSKALKRYLKENAIEKISDTKKQLYAVVRFTINTEGEITNVKVFKTSGDKNTDELLIQTISKMPKWIPAQDAQGLKVKQEFEFTVGRNGGC